MLKHIGIGFCAAALVCVTMLGCTKDEIEPVPAPTLLFPDDGAAFVPDMLTLTWNDTTGASSHAVQVSTNSGFSALTVNEVTASLYLAITTPLANNTTYFWRVNASDGGQTSVWSATFSFTTGVPAPALTNPGSGVICVPDTLTLAWNPMAGATMYYVQLSTDAGFSTFAVNGSSVSPSFAVTSPLEDNMLYYWRVSVAKTQGMSAWSTRNFTTAFKADAPTLVSPADGAAGVTSPVILTWSPSIGTTTYHVQVSSSSDFLSLAADADWLDCSTSGTTTNISLSSGTYYWRVAVKNVDCGSDGDWSAAWSFTTP